MALDYIVRPCLKATNQTTKRNIQVKQVLSALEGDQQGLRESPAGKDACCPSKGPKVGTHSRLLATTYFPRTRGSDPSTVTSTAVAHTHIKVFLKICFYLKQERSVKGVVMFGSYCEINIQPDEEGSFA